MFSGRFSFSESFRRSRWLLVIHAGWSVFVCGLGIWWGSLILAKSQRIADLEQRYEPQAHSRVLEKTKRMIFWEAAAFFLLIATGTAIIFYINRRDYLRSRSIQAFFAAVTHELRTPLTSIRLQAEAIADSLHADSGPQQKLVQRLLEDTTRLQVQVERMLELARVEGGGAVPLETVPLLPWIERVRRQCAEIFGNRLDVQLDVPRSCCVLADSVAVQLIFRNLFENAVRHSGLEKVSVRVFSKAEPPCFRVFVENDGASFQGNWERLGRPFVKGALSRGVGLGLYLVRMLMIRMGGGVVFENMPQGGFRAVLTFRSATKEAGEEEVFL